MERSTVFIVIILVALLGGCLSPGTGDVDIGELTELDGQYRLTYNVSTGSESIDLGLSVYTTTEWQRKELTVSMAEGSSTLSRYRHKPSGEVFYCETSTSSFNASACRFDASYAIYYPLMPTHSSSLPLDDPVFTGTEEIVGRECARYRMTASAQDLYEAGTDLPNSTVEGDVCIDTAQGYISSLRLSANGTGQGGIEMQVTGYSPDVDTAEPDVDIVGQLYCADNTGYQVELLAVREGRDVVVRVNDQERSVALEELEKRTIDIRSMLQEGSNTVEILAGDTVLQRSCEYYG